MGCEMDSGVLRQTGACDAGPRGPTDCRAIVAAMALAAGALLGSSGALGPAAVAPRTDAPSVIAAGALPAAAEAGPGRLHLPLVIRRHERDLPGVFGVQLSEVRFREPDMIRAVHAVGASWWRTFLFWDEVEPTRTVPPTYDWRLYDPLFQTASELGLQVIAEIQGNPKWVAEFPGGPVRDLDALAQFVAAAVERYDGDSVRDAPGHPVVRFWEMYNEPDNVDPLLAADGRGWGYWGFEGAEYARMLKRVYPAVKIASPEAQVVFGGVAYDGFIPNDGPFNPAFVDDVLTADGGAYFDVMNFHYYPLFAGNWRAYGIDVAGKSNAVRAKLEQYGLNKRLFVTEAGSWSAASPPYPDTSPEEQAHYVAQLHARALAAGIDVVCWFQYDDVTGTDDPARGLIDRHLQPKPALTAYRVTSAMLAGARAEGAAPTEAGSDEVYWFRRRSERLAVAWTNDGAVRSLAVPAPAAERTRVMGATVVVADDADGAADGWTHVPYGREPVFVRPLERGR